MDKDSSIASVAESECLLQKINIAPAVFVVLSSDDEECSRKLVPKRSLTLSQPIPKKQKCSRTVTVPVQKLPPVDSVINPNQCIRRVTVPVEDDVVGIKHLVASIPL